tara:strand:- start:1491 stop:2489 length:999 start_codon:yes stop_codon:yes gene_type:complete
MRGKFLGILLIAIVNYLLLTLIVFSFSFISLKNGNVYDLLWIKYIQKKLYIDGGLRNIFQHSTNDCVKFDENLLYVPKEGECKFSNPEFKTKLNFDKERRLNLVDDEINKDEEVIAVLGDSIAMGWGVENDETFAYSLQNAIGKKVINFGVSSYGTVREIKRLKNSKFYNQINTIIIQYHLNDRGENIHMNPEKKYQRKEFDEYFGSYQNKTNSTKYLIRMYKKSLRLLISHLNDLIFPTRNIDEKKFYKDLDALNKVILKNFSNKDKRIIVFALREQWEKYLYDINKEYENFEFFEIEINSQHKFIVDDHPNKKGHDFISQEIYKYLMSSV